MHRLTLIVALLSAVATYAAPTPPVAKPLVKCPIVFDGRVPVGRDADLTWLDSYTTNTIFNPDVVKGNNLKWSQIVKWPAVDASRFDETKYIPYEVTLSDESIFRTQNGLRRAGLKFVNDTSDGVGQQGIKTFHFSVKQDRDRPMNLSHEYLNSWHEAKDYSFQQVQFQAGQLIDNPKANKNDFKITDRTGKILWSVEINKRRWQNFAIKFNYTANQIEIYYSIGAAKLKHVAGPISVNLAGGGQYQFGMIKKSTGAADFINSGYQSSNLNEGQIYGGVFVEDSINNCVSV